MAQLAYDSNWYGNVFLSSTQSAIIKNFLN